MELVEATADDLDAIVRRWYDLAKKVEQYSEMNELVYESAEEAPEDGFRARLDDEEITDYLIVHDAETVGFVTLREGTHPSRQYSQYLRIVNITIDEEHQSEGRGTEVLDRVKALARERGCDHLKVSCEWGNEDARRFYREMGFQPKQVDFVQPLE